MHFRRVLRSITLGLFAVALLGCASDDSLVVDVSVQETTTTTDASATEVSESAEDTEGGDDAVAPAEDVMPRPADDKIEDRRGEATVEVIIRGNTFETRFFRVDPGTQIVFVNRGVNPHNVTPAIDGAFPAIPQEALEESAQALQLDIAGDYPFYCTLHGTKTRGQTGYVIVG